MKSSWGVMDVFQGLDLSSGSDTFRKNNTTNQRDKGSKSDLDDLFSVKEDITRLSPVKQANAQEASKDSVTDLFDPLLTDSKNAVGNHVTQSNLASITETRKNYYSDSKTNVLKDPQLVSYGNNIISPQDNNLRPMNSLNVNTPGSVSLNLKSGSQIFGNGDELSHNRTTQPIVALPASGPQGTLQQFPIQFPFNSHPVVQPPVMSGASTTPLRLPKQSSQRTEFSFVGKSGKADAFSFVQDEMKARK